MQLIQGLFSGGADRVQTVAAFVAVLSILVFVHELGHYLAARWRGVYVEAFSIGFGRALAAWTDRRGTAWKIGWLPLGGYVKLHGQERPQDVSDEVRASWKPGQTYHDKSVGSRAIIIAAGPIANFALAMVVFAGLFMTVGKPVASSLISSVVPGSAAAEAGLLPGDRVVAIDGAAVSRFEDIQRVVGNRPGAQMKLVITRAGENQVIDVTIGIRPKGAQPPGMLGIGGSQLELEQMSPPMALLAGAEQCWDITTQTLSGISEMLTGRRGTDDLGGPLRIAQLSGQAASMGLVPLISLVGLLSVSLGLMNLFPIPVLDGGHLLFCAAEALLGRPVPRQAMEYGFRAGFAVIISLGVFVTWNDLSHLGVMRWVSGLIG